MVPMVPMSLRDLIEAGGVEAQVRAAGDRAMRREREFWLETLQRHKMPEDGDLYEQLALQSYIASLRRKLGIKPDVATVRAQTRERVRRHRQRSRHGRHHQRISRPDD